MATQAQVGLIADTLIEVFEGNLDHFKASMQAIKLNTEKVTIDNQISAIRREINAFVEAKEAEIQTLLSM